MKTDNNQPHGANNRICALCGKWFKFRTDNDVVCPAHGPSAIWADTAPFSGFAGTVPYPDDPDSRIKYVHGALYEKVKAAFAEQAVEIARLRAKVAVADFLIEAWDAFMKGATWTKDRALAIEAYRRLP